MYWNVCQEKNGHCDPRHDRELSPFGAIRSDARKSTEISLITCVFVCVSRVCVCVSLKELQSYVTMTGPASIRTHMQAHTSMHAYECFSACTSNGCNLCAEKVKRVVAESNPALSTQPRSTWTLWEVQKLNGEQLVIISQSRWVYVRVTWGDYGEVKNKV